MILIINWRKIDFSSFNKTIIFSYPCWSPRLNTVELYLLSERYFFARAHSRESSIWPSRRNENRPSIHGTSTRWTWSWVASSGVTSARSYRADDSPRLSVPDESSATACWFQVSSPFWHRWQPPSATPQSPCRGAYWDSCWYAIFYLLLLTTTTDKYRASISREWFNGWNSNIWIYRASVSLLFNKFLLSINFLHTITHDCKLQSHK